MESGLENIINVEVKRMTRKKKVMVTSDYHIPFMDKKNYLIMKRFAKDYKPNEFIINGDFMDFYSVSKYDKNPERKLSVKEELFEGRKVLSELKEALPDKCKITILEGNHEYRLQSYLWKNTELFGLDELKIENMLNFKKMGIDFIGADGDYWKNDNGHLRISDMLIMHGDNRLNGASYSKYSGYSAKNTMMSLGQNIIIGHTHRLGQVYHTTPYINLIGMECGNMCQATGTADWQPGFLTFEYNKNGSFNHKIYHIKENILYTDNKTYKMG